MAVANDSPPGGDHAPCDAGPRPRRDPCALYRAPDLSGTIGQVVGPSLDGRFYVVVYADPVDPDRRDRWRATFLPATARHLESARGVVAGHTVLR